MHRLLLNETDDYFEFRPPITHYSFMEPLDIEQTARLAALAATPPDQRDEDWCDQVLAAAPNASLAALDPQIEDGPDTFPYFQLALPQPGPFTPFSIVHVLDHVLAAGAGVVIHANLQRDRQPLWVFTFGDILSYSLYGDFKGDPKVYTDSTPPNPDDHELLRASPSESYLPATARAALGRFMRGPFQHPSPKIGLVTGASLTPPQNLMVNLRLSDYHGDGAKLNDAMGYLTWFVPKSYALMALPDDWSDADMAPL